MVAEKRVDVGDREGQVVFEFVPLPVLTVAAPRGYQFSSRRCVPRGDLRTAISPPVSRIFIRHVTRIPKTVV